MIKSLKIKAFTLLLLISLGFFTNTSPANAITLCYDIEIFIFKVGESCISYKDMDDEILTESFMRTVNIGSVAKRVNDKGYAIANRDGLKPKKFVFYQEEGNFKRYQSYDFEEGKIKVRETKYKGLTDEIENDENKTYQYKGQRDPYTLALFLFKEVFKSQSGNLSLFYDDKSYLIPYQVLKDELVKIKDKKYDTKQVLIKPEIKGKGLLRPKGNWYIWVDKKTQLPVKMSVGFIIGSVDVVLAKME
ncbi:MAG: DUF3108 domain-containing protein [Proteobacteria bacterium]|nr:DUF3108 domain-containing protein [Pseudomonadota bacterium]